MELRELRVLVRDLQERVRILELRADRSEPSYPAPSREQVPLTPPRTPQRSFTSTLPSSAASSPSAPVVDREVVCKDVGAWVARALRGEHRGLSGRERLSPGSKIYLLFKDYEGNTYNPVQIFHRWSDLCPPVSAAGSVEKKPRTGSSVYIGLPSQADARLVVHSAGLQWPERQ